MIGNVTTPPITTPQPFSFRTKICQLAEKVSDFFRRYWKDIVVYGMTILATFLASCYSPGLGRACQSGAGFFWVIGNSPGKPLAKDFLEEIPDSHLGHFENTGDELSQRFKIIDRIYQNLQRSPTERSPTIGWSLLHGNVGTGKSEAARYVAHRLKHLGHQVFLLRTGRSLSYSDSYSLINNKFRGVSPTPVLIIDEAREVIQGGWQELKQTLSNPPNFNVLAIAQSLNGVDEGIKSRVSSEEWPVPSKACVIKLIRAKSNYSDVERVVNRLCIEDNVPQDLLRRAWKEIEISENQAPTQPL